MTKEQLKAAIRKILEKEGGAAGMKALKKQSDSSEKDIKASIKDDEKVGQHPDGDYILGKGKVSVSEMVEEEVAKALEEKKKKKKGKKDACYHKVRSRYDVWPSAYASGALVKCRKVGAANWGNSKKEADEPEIDDGEEKQIKKVISQLTKSVKMHDDQAEFLKKLIDEEIGFFLEKKRKLTSKPSSESSLRDWFKRKGAKGKKGGWVDCNTCRKDKKTGRKKCSPCGRSGGEKRAKYPSCRPTPGACGKRGKYGKKSKAGKKG
jgi:hypothetical protein